ncbi:MAG TPA: hypothetical protein VIO94_02285 [Phenylobacterium sp.]
MGVRTLIGALALALGLAGAAHAERFSFVALGDTAYNPPGDLPKYEALIGTINRAKPAFTIHVGDTWGAKTCTEENHRWVLGFFQRYDHPVFYTPGDNEWTDCRKPDVLEAYIRYETGKASPADMMMLGAARQFDNAFAGTSFGDPGGSLDIIRQVFFAKPQSLGQRPAPMVRQSDVSDFKEVAENARWEKGGVVFATVAVPGSGNGFTLNDETRAKQAIRENQANVAWIKAAFDEAKAKSARAVVIALQAGMFEDARGNEFSGKRLRGGEEGPYYWVAFAIRDGAARFGKPVLLINGDFHQFVVDQPFMVSQGESKPPLYNNITRVQVFGAPEIKAVKINVDTDTPWVFGFEPLYVTAP